VDEDGTEAAAATAVIGTNGVPPTPIPVTLDRPFLFFVQDKTGLVLFAGQIVDPTS
jgi:serpin B